MRHQTLHQLVDQYRKARTTLTDRDRPVERRRDDLRGAMDALRAVPITPGEKGAGEALQVALSGSLDIVIRHLVVGGSVKATLAYLDAMVSAETLAAVAIFPLTRCVIEPSWSPGQLTGAVEQSILTAGSLGRVKTLGEAIDSVLAGDAVLLVDGAVTGFWIRIPAPPLRSIEEPVTEPVIRGPREGFIESLDTNLSLVRRRLRTPYLQTIELIIGRSSRTRVAILYQCDIADPGLVAEVRQRLERIDLEAVGDSAYLEELIEDNPLSIFPQVQNSERADAVAANIAEGRVAILIDQSPSALIVPVTVWSFLQASEDYYERYPIAIFLRLLRVALAWVALVGPAFWIAIVSYHQELLPTALLLTVLSSREGIPFPVLIEGLLMELFFEALREAGVRLPRPVGQAVSIVGALVLGEAAVQAGIVSAPMVIIVATTGIASFAIPRFSFGIALRLLRLALMLLSGILGLFGLLIGLLWILFHLAALRSFGVPYLQPLAPLTLSDLKDTLVRFPHWLMDRRPEFLKVLDRRRRRGRLRPRPPGGAGRS